MIVSEGKVQGAEVSKGVVFVVDDDASVRRGLGSLFRSAGLNVEVFASAAEMEQSPRSESANCLVLDVRLPTLNGLELQEHLARSNRQIPIIFITGHADVPMTIRAMKGGAIDFFTKPVDGRAILGAVSAAIDRDRKRRESENCRGSTAGFLRDAHATRAGGHGPCDGRAHEQAGRGRNGPARDNREDSPRQNHEKNEGQVASRSGQDGRQPATSPAHDLSTTNICMCCWGDPA